MKKISALIVIALASSALLTSCKKSDEKPAATGSADSAAATSAAVANTSEAAKAIVKSWKYKAMTIDGKPLGISTDTLSASDKTSFETTYADFLAKSSWTFNDDGTFETHVFLNGEEKVSKGKWTMSADGKQIDATYEAGNSAQFTVTESNATSLILTASVNGANTRLELGQ